MTIKKLTDQEFESLYALKKAVLEVTRLGGRNSNINNFLHDKEVTEHDLDGLLSDFNYDELFACIIRYIRGETKIVATDTDGVGFNVVEILHRDYDNVFGFIESSDGTIEYHYCETKTNWNDELERDETHFFVDNDPVILDDCIRKGAWA